MEIETIDRNRKRDRRERKIEALVTPLSPRIKDFGSYI
jgi:hypothetical protein